MNKTSSPFARSMHILETVAASGRPLSLHQLAQRTGLPVSTAYRMAKSLVESGHLSREEQSGMYGVGPRLHRLGQYLVDRGSIESMAGPVLYDLCASLEDTVFMTRFNGHEVEVVSEASPQENFRAYVNPGQIFPIHATASGKMLYALQPPDVIEEALAVPLHRYGPKTMTDPRDIRAHLKLVRDRGYALSDEELDPGVFSVACPVDVANAGSIYALCVVGVRDGLLARHEPEALVHHLKQGAAALAIALSPDC